MSKRTISAAANVARSLHRSPDMRDRVITRSEKLAGTNLEAVEALLRFVEQANAEGNPPDTETWLKLLGKAFRRRHRPS